MPPVDAIEIAELRRRIVNLSRLLHAEVRRDRPSRRVISRLTDQRVALAEVVASVRAGTVGDVLADADLEVQAGIASARERLAEVRQRL